MSRRLRLSLALLVWLAPQASWACEQLFVQIGGIPGSAADAQHQGWIDAVGFSEAVSRTVSPGTATGAMGGAAQFSDLAIVKRIDRASPLLRLAVADGRSIPQVRLDCVDASGASILKIELEGVVLTQVSATLQPEDQAGPRESVAFNFSKVKWTVTDQSGNPIQAGWDRSTNRSF
jgi:type VI secretion system secreted protein Hcp